MVKNHMKRLTMPTTWNVLRKKHRFVTRPKAGGHSQDLGISLNTFLKELTSTTSTTKETKYILTKQEVHVNGTRKRSHKHQVGYLDVVTIPSQNKSYRLLINNKGKLTPKEITDEEAKKLYAIIKNKTNLKGNKTQINTTSGENIIEETTKTKDYKTGDTIIVSLPDKKIIGHIKKQEGSHVVIFLGKHTGKNGTIEKIEQKIITIKTKDETIQTKKEYTIITGTKKPEIEVEVQ